MRDGARVHVIPLDKLDYAQAQDDYVELHSGGKSYLKQQPIGSLEAALDPARFVRIHRSAIVNLERVTRIEPYGKESRIAILEDGTRLPVSRLGYARLLEAMGDGPRAIRRENAAIRGRPGRTGRPGRPPLRRTAPRGAGGRG